MKAGHHVWADERGRITPRSAAAWVTNLILAAGGQASTAYRCGELVARDVEENPAKFATQRGFKAITVRPDRIEALKAELKRFFPDAKIIKAKQIDEIIYWQKEEEAEEFAKGSLRLETCRKCGAEGPDHETCPGPIVDRGAIMDPEE